MSASLVGSEMCIRDRFSPHRTCTKRSLHMRSPAVPTTATGTIATTPRTCLLYTSDAADDM
eukprot:13695847-Alexandrium_andersonii.AAC.1